MNKSELRPFIFGTRSTDLIENNRPELPAHERISALFAQIIQENDPAQSRPLLVQLGIHPEDISGLERMHSLILQAKDAKVSLFKQAENAPIYQLKIGKECIGFFKIGRKRTAIELLVRQVAFLTGLAEHTVPGVFCSMGNYRSLQWEDVFEDLWNGQLKNYQDTSDQGSAIVGMLEPCAPRKKTTSLEEFAKMTFLALVVGLRDGKDDGYGGSSWFDCEDAFPIRLDPPDINSIAATDLPYLSDSKAKEPLSLEIISKLKTLVQAWDLEKIRTHLQQAMIDYADTKAEDAPFLADDETETAELFDEGNNAIVLTTPDRPHAINGPLNHWDIEQNPDRLCLLPNQIETTLLRIRRIQEFLQSNDSFCLLDLVFDVDPWAKKYSEYCDYLNNTPDSPIKREVESDLALGGVPLVTGRRTPRSLSTNPETFETWMGRMTPLNLSFRHTPKS